MSEPGTSEDRSAPLRRFDAVLGAIDRAVSGVVIVLLGTLCVVIFAQVFYRYVLNSSLDWALSVPRVCFVLLVLLAIPLGFRRNRHVGVTILFDRLPEWLQPHVLRLNAVLMTGLMVFVAWLAYQMMLVTWDQYFPSLRVSIGVFYAGIIVSAVHTVLHLARIAWTGTATQHESDVE